MKKILSLASTVVLSALVFSSCMKEEKPYALSEVPDDGGEYKIGHKQVSIGEDYTTQVFFNLTTGESYSSAFKSWDLGFTMGAGASEVWMNGGKAVLIYPTGNKTFSAVTTLGSIPATAWKYDDHSGLPGKSGLGVLTSENHVGEVLIVDDGLKTYFKLQILEITATQYKIKAGPLEDPTGTEVILEKDDNYNFAYYSFTGGIVKPEPPKKDWDIQFTRYRHIYYKYNADGTDFLYLVNGVLSNPYKTQSGDDQKSYDFYNFTLADAEKFTLKPDRDVIGFDWKVVDINSGAYTVTPKAMFVVKDQHDALWKFHFTGFYNSQGRKGYPSFEFQRIK